MDVEGKADTASKSGCITVLYKSGLKSLWTLLNLYIKFLNFNNLTTITRIMI